MFREEKNLKDLEEKQPASYGTGSIRTSFTLSYTKTNKLITALYMVTDIIEKEEPLRNKLRTLGASIISDINSAPGRVCTTVSEILSFLDIASAMNIISEMNCSILRKEFMELDQAIRASDNQFPIPSKSINLSEFFEGQTLSQIPEKGNHKGHTNIGVQKGSTLLHALSDRSLISSIVSDTGNGHKIKEDFDILKNKRRQEILYIIKSIGGNATIKDIRDKVETMPIHSSSLMSSSEKTLQRELVSMVKNGVLNKTGEKRWSKYFIK